MVKQEIKKLLEKVLSEMDIDAGEISVDYSDDPKHGDYASNVALVSAKKLGRDPMEIAEEVAKRLRMANGEWQVVEKVEVARPGFVNIWVADEAFMNQAYELIDEIKLSDIGNGQKVVVEYSSPNIAKPFTIGHLRSTIIGDAVANLLEAVGYKVFRDNHIGDWGTQFGKQIYAIKAWGNEEEIEKSDRPVKLLVDLYIRFHDEAEKDPTLEDEARGWFKKLEDGDTEARRLWEKCIEWSWKEFDLIYKQLGVSFTENKGRGYGEAFFEDKMKPIMQELKEKHLLKEGENRAQLVFFLNDEYPPLMILKQDGATLYATRDLATDKFRLEHYGKDVLVVNEVGAEQSLYFKQLYKLESMLGWFKPEKRVHIKHGLYRFKEGKMSTRKGNVIWLEEVLLEAEKRAMLLGKDNQETAQAVAIGAIKWNDLKRSPEQDITFDWDEILNMQGNSGPYLQYTFARTQSVLHKAKDTKYKILNTKYKLAPEERDLLRLLACFDEVVIEAAKRFAPNVLTTYLFGLGQAFNLFYQKHQILKGEEKTQQFRLALTSVTGATLKQGLSLLGIQSPDRM